MALSKFEAGVLKGWFDRRIKMCGGDVKLYDFDALLDRSLGYYENKTVFERIVDNLCGQTPSGRKAEEEEMAHMAVEADEYHAERLRKEGTTCKMCGAESRRVDGVSAEMNKLICELLCASGVGKVKKKEYYERVYEEEF